MIIEYLSKNFPAADATDGQYLYRSLGSFWTGLFKDSNALQGYTIGMAEELIQSYYKLIEVIHQHSIKNIPILHKEKWLPIIIKKSEFNNSSLLFSENSAVFGTQPEEDKFYSNTLFRFGQPKKTNGENIFSFQPKINLKKHAIIANRVIAPSLLLLPGVDTLFIDGVIYFNSDIFNNKYVPKTKLVQEFGHPEVFVDSSGREVQDEFVILWAYNAEIDNDELYKQFGVLFDIKLPTSAAYHELLKSLMNLAVEGPTISALSTAFAAMANIPITIEAEETVEDIYDELNYRYIITDKNVYKADTTHTLNSAIKIGAKLKAGTVITESISVIDSVISPNWWQHEITTNKLAFASHIFLANAKNQLFFETGVSLITYTKGKLTFPVLGNSQDTAVFQEYINIPENKLGILEGIGIFENTPVCLSNEIVKTIRVGQDFNKYIFTDKNAYRIARNRSIPQHIQPGVSLNSGEALIMLDADEAIQDFYTSNIPLPIIPTDFLFSNVFKNNIMLLKLMFNTPKQLANFFKLYPLMKQYLPSHVYILIYINLDLGYETLDNLNKSLTIEDFAGQFFSADGSLLTGKRPEKPVTDPEYYKDYINRLFCISVGPYKDDMPLHVDENLEKLYLDNSTSRSTSGGIKAGLLRTRIPKQVIPPGESTPRVPTTEEIQAILLIDF
jgi:hypothetical protein